MTNAALKTKIHEKIDRIEDKTLLQKYFEIIELLEADKDDNLTYQQKQEVMKAYKESDNPENLISHEEVMKKYGKWFLWP